MTTRTTRASVLVAILFLSVAMLSCTGTEILAPGSFPFKFESTVSNPSSASVCTTLTFSTVSIRPLDPLAADPLGGTPIGLITSSVDGVRFKGDPCPDLVTTLDLPTATLPSGDYEIEQFEFGSAKFYDGTTSVFTNQQGEEITVANFTECFGSANYVQFEPVVFTIGPGRSNTVRLVLNEQLLIDDQISTFVCSGFSTDPLPFFTIEPQ